GAPQWLVSPKQHHDHAVGMTGGHAMQQHVFAAQSDCHILVKDSIGDCGWNFLADDGFQRSLVCDDQCAVILEDLSAADVVRVSVGENYVFHRNVKTPPDLVAQPGRSAGHSRIDDQGAL